uniref:Ig-like domain-containing protein n=1 Tax=Astyanax mexicanus TaxID=7994 RepID=A0A3B1KHE7_ASTMX
MIKYFFLTGVHCVELSQSGSTVVAPGQSTTLTCRVSGYSLTDWSYCTHWIRHPAGKALEWIGRICAGGGTDNNNKLKSRFQISRDTSSSTVSLRGQNLQTEDTAVYYCARQYHSETHQQEPCTKTLYLVNLSTVHQNL